MYHLRSVHHVGSWVVYQTAGKRDAGVSHGVCEQAEWDEMERLSPGRHRLIQSGIGSEGEAERLARGTSGDRPTHKKKKKRKPLVP